MENTRRELKEECDYEVEKLKQIKYQKMLSEFEIDKEYVVPNVIEELSTKWVLVSEFRDGLTIDQVSKLS